MIFPCEGCGKDCVVKGTERYVICDRCWNYLGDTTPKPVEPPDPELLDLIKKD